MIYYDRLVVSSISVLYREMRRVRNDFFFWSVFQPMKGNSGDDLSDWSWSDDA